MGMNKEKRAAIFSALIAVSLLNSFIVYFEENKRQTFVILVNFNYSSEERVCKNSCSVFVFGFARMKAKRKKCVWNLGRKHKVGENMSQKICIKKTIRKKIRTLSLWHRFLMVTSNLLQTKWKKKIEILSWKCVKFFLYSRRLCKRNFWVRYFIH